MMRRMNYLLGMKLGKMVKRPIVQDPIISTATPPFGLGYKPTDDDLLEMEVKRMARAKAKAKGLPCPLKPPNPYTLTLNEKFVKAADSQRYWGFLEPRFDPETRTMVLGFELLFDCNNQLPKLKKEDTNWIPTDWADYMDPDAVTTLLGDAICNIEEGKYWEACQHALKSLYEARTSDEEGREAPSDDDEGSNIKNDSSSGSSSSDNGDSENDSNSDSESNNKEDYDSQYSGNDWAETPGDREDEDERPFYEDHFDDDVIYYDGDIEDDAETELIDIESDAESEEYGLENVLKAAREEVEDANNIDYDDYPYRHPSDWKCIANVS